MTEKQLIDFAWSIWDYDMPIMIRGKQKWFSSEEWMKAKPGGVIKLVDRAA